MSALVLSHTGEHADILARMPKLTDRSTNISLPGDYLALVDYVPRTRNDRMQRRFMIFGPKPTRRRARVQLRPTLAAGYIEPAGACVIDYGLVRPALLEALAAALRAP